MRARTDVLTLDDTITCSFERNVNELHFTTPEGDAKTAEVPYIWYKGYEAVDETGAELPVTMSDHGFVSVNCRAVCTRLPSRIMQRLFV